MIMVKTVTIVLQYLRMTFLDILKKTARRNSLMHSVYMVLGLGVSILFLSTLIPKMQYWITKKRTGKEGFPGAVEENTAA